MRGRVQFLANSQRTKMYFLRLGVTAFIGVKYSEIIEDRSYIGMIGTELLL